MRPSLKPPFVLAVLVSSLAAQDPLLRLLDAPYDGQRSDLIAFGDLDGDGAAEGVFSTMIGVNDGTGRLTATPWTGPTGWYDAVIADITGDGDPDLLVAAYVASCNCLAAPHVSIGLPGAALLGPVTGLPALLPAGGSAVMAPAAVDAGDVDGDGDLDVVWLGTSTASSNSANWGHFPVLWRNGGGGLIATVPSATGAPYVGSQNVTARLSDVDTDGDLDLVVASYPGASGGSVRVALNQSGVFGPLALVWSTTAATVSAAFADVNGDGAKDVLVYGNGQLRPLLTGPGGLTPTGPYPVTNCHAISAVDYDGDTIPDLLEWTSAVFSPGAYGLTVRSLAANGIPGAVFLTVPSATRTRLLPGSERDMDNDGDLDAAFHVGALDQPYNVGGPLGFLMNGGTTATLTVTGRLGLTGDAFFGTDVAGDFDGDGDLDRLETAVIGGALNLTPLLNDGHGFFTRGTAVVGPALLAASYVAPAAFDRDGDGDDDLYLASNVAGSSGAAPSDYVFDAAGGTLTLVATIPSAFGNAKVAAGDVDQNGLADIVVARQGVGTFVALNQAGTLAAPFQLAPAATTEDLFLRDFDADGDLDVLTVIRVGTGVPTTLFVNAAGTFTAIAQPASASGPAFGAAVAGDFDGDPYADLVAGNVVHFGSATGAFTAGPALTPGLAPFARSADFDGDGLDDLFESSGDRRAALGAGVFGPRVAAHYAVAANLQGAPLLADFDRDADIDVVMRVGPGVALLSNCARQLASGALPRPARNATLDLYGAPGGGYALFVATGPANVSAGGFGTVFIDPLSAVQIAAGFHPGTTSPSAGKTTFSFFVPGAPGLVGLSLWWQAVDLTSLHVTNRIESKILGY